jgi:hypothetical protein
MITKKDNNLSNVIRKAEKRRHIREIHGYVYSRKPFFCLFPNITAVYVLHTPQAVPKALQRRVRKRIENDMKQKSPKMKTGIESKKPEARMMNDRCNDFK